jgi:HAE1 family hydrophobic/amphiphilic exporter-1
LIEKHHWRKQPNLHNNMGQQLSQFATIVGFWPKPIRAKRQNSICKCKVKCWVPTGTIVTQWQEKLDKLEKTCRCKIFGGDQENQSEGFGTLGIALLAAIVLVYLVMVSFMTVCTPICSTLSIPLSFIGALLALALTTIP